MSNRQSGFTIIEMMIATTIFSIIMLVAAAGILKFTHAYFKGVTSSDTQTVARTIMADLVQNIQFGQSVTPAVTVGTDGSKGICVDNTLYSFRVGAEVTPGSPDATRHLYNHGLIKQIDAACSAAKAVSVTNVTSLGSLSGDVREMLSEQMRIADLTVSSTGDRLYTIHLKVIYGDDDLLTDVSSDGAIAGAGCRSQAGSQYCAVSELTTTVQQRQ